MFLCWSYRFPCGLVLYLHLFRLASGCMGICTITPTYRTLVRWGTPYSSVIWTRDPVIERFSYSERPGFKSLSSITYATSILSTLVSIHPSDKMGNRQELRLYTQLSKVRVIIISLICKALIETTVLSAKLMCLSPEMFEIRLNDNLYRQTIARQMQLVRITK